MAPLRSFEVSRRIAVSIDLDRTAARAWTKSFAPYFGVVAAVAPSLCMCLKGYCSPLTPLVVARCTSRLSLSNTVERARSAAISSNSWWKKHPSIPSFPWSAEDKLIAVVLERCYGPFTSAKVVLFLGLFSPFHFHRFLNLFGMCELHLRTFAVAGDHGRKNFFPGSFERIPTASTAPWTPLHVRSTAPWTRTRTSEKATFLLPVCTRNTYSALVGLFSI